ncbi:hypothetical protein KYK30_20545 [Shinella yambaruensis]|uniref:Mu-like prophage FluMu N-terminal domain-containing protein n=1 Tax=Shinella yambaruensis TaxID=415996 RepID=A0ABQ5ZEP3_9HYPH|nr:hypothetical protein [Shinella yambaruensis]MCJ8027015.1 hypothetical protein [Shinella yambaruensis]MCU7982093.1 hypothetical protein [Shinella yambaruensis]GLR51268.1 hypothetical protein GCM10007923_24760 [Shinella yambaruensis]
MAPKTSAKPEDMSLVARRVIVVTAPAGPRRRAGYGFGPHETKFYEGDIAEDELETLVTAWRADPMLKIDFRMEEVPAPAKEDAGE